MVEERRQKKLPFSGIRYQTKALGQRVLAVAVINYDARDWTAYVDAVDGVSHCQEWKAVKDHGNKLHKVVAEAIFCNIKPVLDEYGFEYRW